MEELIKAFGLDWRLLLIQMFNFGLVLLILWYFLYRPMMRMIDKRQKKVIEGIEDSERAREELETVEKKKNDILTKANTQAEELYADGKKYAEEKKSEILQDAQTRSELALHEAETRGKEIKEQFLRESKEEVAKMTILAAEQVLRQGNHKNRTKENE